MSDFLTTPGIKDMDMDYPSRGVVPDGGRIGVGIYVLDCSVLNISSTRVIEPRETYLVFPQQLSPWLLRRVFQKSRSQTFHLAVSR